MNTKTVPNCPKCQTKGNVIDHHKKFVKLECPKCNSKWTTLSKKCPECDKPNGYAVDGVCSSCYGKYYKSF
jgi:primosomal protein N'